MALAVHWLGHLFILDQIGIGNGPYVLGNGPQVLGNDNGPIHRHYAKRHYAERPYFADFFLNVEFS